MNRVVVASPAKINWMLRVLRRRADGYHDIETIFETISLHDEVELEESAQLTVTCDDAAIPQDRSNLAWRAAEAMQARYSCPPVAITLRKRIPAGGGLGGGSSNAAAVIRGMTSMFSVDAEQRDLERIALEIGSDVPFFLRGGLAYATGRGEVLTFLGPRRDAIPLLLILPEERMPTAEAYRLIAERRSDARELAGELLGLESARRIAIEPESLAGELINDLEPVVFDRLGRLAEWKRVLASETAPRWSGMSGSGSALVAAYRTAEERAAAAGRMRREGVEIVEAETAAALPPLHPDR